MRLKFFSSTPSFGDVASAASHGIGARNAIGIFQSRPGFGDVASASGHDVGARNANEIFFEVDQALDMLRVPLVTILALEMRLKFFQVDQRLQMLRMALVTIFARKMRLKIFWSRPSFGDVASAASHHDWWEKCDWKFFQVHQALETLRVPLVTILARKMRLKFFSSWPSFGDVASGAGHDIGARNAIEIFWSPPSFGDVASSARHDIGARNAIEILRNRPMFGDVASGAGHDIGARNAIEFFLLRGTLLSTPLPRKIAGEHTRKKAQSWKLSARLSSPRRPQRPPAGQAIFVSLKSFFLSPSLYLAQIFKL